MIQKVGFVGGGNMACAMIEGMASLGVQIAVSDPAGTRAKAELMKDNVSLVTWADLVVLAVKPHIMPAAMAEISSACADKPIVSIAAGLGTDALKKALPGARVCRTMPNTPAMLGQGMSALSLSHTLTDDEYAFVQRMFGCIGVAVEVEEDHFSAVTALSGSGPAYFYLAIEAMADAGVRHGLARSTAYRLAAQTAVGAGTMVRDSGRSPGTLKDEVTSPNGTTIAAICALEKAGLRSAMMDAVEAAYLRAEELS